jgi:hypothetical protein
MAPSAGITAVTNSLSAFGYPRRGAARTHLNLRARATLPWLSRRDRAIGGCRPARWEKHCHRRRCHGAIKDSHHSAFRSALTCRLPPYRVATCRRTDRESPTRRAALIAPREALKSKCCECLAEFPAPHRHPGGVRATPCLENPPVPVVLTVRLPARGAGVRRVPHACDPVQAHHEHAVRNTPLSGRDCRFGSSNPRRTTRCFHRCSGASSCRPAVPLTTPRHDWTRASCGA